MTGRRWVRAIGRALPCLLMASLLVTLGCKGGGNNNDGSGPLPCTNLSFTRALSSPANGDVYLQGVTSTCSTIDVSVDVANLSGIFTVGFDLTYPSSIVSYQTFFKGSLLQKNNPATPPYFLVTNPSSGSLQVAMTRFAPDTGVSAVGSEVLITFRFSKVSSGSGTIDFNTGSSSLPEEVQDSDGSLRPASFGPGHGGTVMVP